LGAQAEIGVIGGSGFYEFLARRRGARRQHAVRRAVRPTGDRHVGGRSVAFLPRHGRGPPAAAPQINYRANIAALESVGVQQIIAPCAVGSLRADVPARLPRRRRPAGGPDVGRAQTFYDGPRTVHVSFADPYCAYGRSLALAAAASTASSTGTRHARGRRGTALLDARRVPWYAAAGWERDRDDRHPEAVLARERALCYTTLALVTDYDVGVEGRPRRSPRRRFSGCSAPTSGDCGGCVFDVIPRLPAERGCECARALDGIDTG
jgi:5'-methylthioadenosine phosphorylase